MTTASIECSDQPLDLAFHPSNSNLVAAALVDGTIEVHDFQEQVQESAAECDDDTIVSSTAVHTQLVPSKTSELGSKQASCRVVSFSNDGKLLYTGGSAGDLVGNDANMLSTFTANSSPKSILWRIPDASYQKSSLQVFHEFHHSSHSLLATGDEAGGLRLWDTRIMGTSKKNAGCVQSWKEHDDYISGIEHSSDGNTILASSADCTLSVYDLRMANQKQDKDKVIRRSDDQEDELLSIKLIKNGKKIVCGTGEGVLAVWSWGTYGDVSDRFPGHPASIDALLKVDEDTLLTGASDGLIRVVQIHPDKLLGILGDHGGLPIEKLEFNADRSFVGSVTHDNLIRLWDARVLKDSFNDDGDYIKEKDDMKMDAATMVQAQYKPGRDSDDEWEDMDEDTEEIKDSDDSEDSDSDDDAKPASKNDSRVKKFKTENEEFFTDL